jgi:hypothetical protein
LPTALNKLAVFDFVDPASKTVCQQLPISKERISNVTLNRPGFSGDMFS